MQNEDIGPAPAAEAPTQEWAIVEVYGHRRHVGRISEEQRFGAAMLRIDVPSVTDYADGTSSEVSWVTHWYGGGAIFSITPIDEAGAMRVARTWAPSPAKALTAVFDEGDDDDPDEDDGEREWEGVV